MATKEKAKNTSQKGTASIAAPPAISATSTTAVTAASSSIGVGSSSSSSRLANARSAASRSAASSSSSSSSASFTNNNAININPNVLSTSVTGSMTKSFNDYKKGKKPLSLGVDASAAAVARAHLGHSADFKTNNDNIANVLTNFKSQIDTLDEEIKVIQSGDQNYKNHLFLLEQERADLLAKIKEDEDWAKEFDKDFDRFESRYVTLKGSIEGLYSHAKTKHAEGLQLLIDHFNYHPAFKRWHDEFSACPFKPK